MIVSHARRFIFFHNPKCAGMSFREALDPYHDDPFKFWGIYSVPFFRNVLDHSHIRLWELQQLFQKVFACTIDYNSVIFVRNPWDRFVSAIDEHFKKFQQKILLRDLQPTDQTRIIEQFIDQMLNIANITTNWTFVHFSPQLWQIAIGSRIVPRHIIPMRRGDDFFARAIEALGLPVTAVPWRNQSPTPMAHILDSPKVDQFVRNFYALDLEFFRSRPDLAVIGSRN
ncbi:sulfotransferase family 2 domain-containing protein [Rhodoblastus sp.]|uniref:sulfotransferase family 2 domain-containing protein n=1 Tax=Rhodoblastus sp. TaxID=1962975 RepID=UPI003F9C0C14